MICDRPAPGHLVVEHVVRSWPKADELDDAIGRQLSRVRRTCCNVVATAAPVQAEAEDDAKFVVTGVAPAYPLGPMKVKPLPTGFIVPAQPVKASKPPVGTDWVHEIKHDGYRLIVRRDGPTMWLYSRNAHDWTARLSAIATPAEQTKAKSFTIDGEAVVLGPDGLSRFEELRRREAAHAAILICLRPDRA
jgi:ATP-dependent DNA ligase